MKWLSRWTNRCSGVLVRVHTEQSALALTFDDGPSPEATPALLELLAAYRAKATFFMVGQRAAAHPRLVASVLREGHAVGAHTWDHPSLPLVSRAERWRQFRKCAEVLPRTRGRLLFRPPYGHFDAACQWDAFCCGLLPVAWSAILPDWEMRAASDLLQHAESALRPGAVLAMHDGLVDWMQPGQVDRRATLQTVESLLAAHAENYRFVTLPELMRVGRPVRQPWRMQPDLAMLNQLQRLDGPARRYPCAK